MKKNKNKRLFKVVDVKKIMKMVIWRGYKRGVTFIEQGIFCFQTKNNYIKCFISSLFSKNDILSKIKTKLKNFISLNEQNAFQSRIM